MKTSESCLTERRGLIAPNTGILCITEKGCAYRNSGGYSRERRERVFSLLWQHGASISGAVMGALAGALISWLLR